MFRLFSSANLMEAYLLLHRLVQAGIEARVLNEHAQGGLGEIPFTHAYPEVWVMEAEDAERARGILQEFERRASSDETLVCANCGETSPAGFDFCWQCGRPLR